MDIEFVCQPTPEYPSCHGSSIAVLPDGRLACAWFSGPAEGSPRTVILFSRRSSGRGTAGTAWEPPRIAAWLPGHPHGNGILYAADGELWLFYVRGYGRHFIGWCLDCKILCRRSADGGESWSEEAVVLDELGCLAKNKPILLRTGELLLPTYSDRANDSRIALWDPRRQRWTHYGAVRGADGADAIQPSAVELADGTIVMWLRSHSERIYATRSTDAGRTWTAAERTPLPNPDSGIDAVRLTDGRILLCCNPTTRGRTPLIIAVSENDGRTFNDRLTLESAPGEYSYPAIIQASDGKVHVTYTYRRTHIRHVSFDPATV